MAPPPSNAFAATAEARFRLRVVAAAAAIPALSTYSADLGLLLHQAIELYQTALRSSDPLERYVRLECFAGIMLRQVPRFTRATSAQQRNCAEVKRHVANAIDEMCRVKELWISETVDMMMRTEEEEATAAPGSSSKTLPTSISLMDLPIANSPATVYPSQQPLIPLYPTQAQYSPACGVSAAPKSQSSSSETTKGTFQQPKMPFIRRPPQPILRLPELRRAPMVHSPVYYTNPSEFLANCFKPSLPASMSAPGSSCLSARINDTYSWLNCPQPSLTTKDSVPAPEPAKQRRELSPRPRMDLHNFSPSSRMNFKAPVISTHSSAAYTEFRHHGFTHPGAVGTLFPSESAPMRCPAVGLKNLGNSCFMNSIMQCLYGTEVLVRYFASGEYRKHVNPNNQLGSGGQMAFAFFGLVQEMQRGAGSFIAPVSFRDRIGSRAPHFTDGSQQDSHEFLSYVLDMLHEDLREIETQKNQHGKPLCERAPTRDDGAVDPWRPESKIAQLFHGTTQTTLQCQICSHKSVTQTPFSTLALPLPHKSRGEGVALQTCLDEYMRPEILDDENAWACPKCERRVRALQRTRITWLPPVLVVTLKRFQYSGHFRDKINTLVEFPAGASLLDLGGHLAPELQCGYLAGRPLTYKLYAVSNHYGGMDGGHYTAFVKHGDGNWYHFDDSRFTRCSATAVVTTAAYNLFYVMAAMPTHHEKVLPA